MFSAKNHLYKITEEFSLCDKLNGISQAKKNCSKYDDGNCKGACIEKEDVETYNTRVKEAITKYSLKDKNVLLVDKGREIGEHSAVLIRNGSLVGTGYYDLNHQINNIHILESIITPMNGTENANFILETYLRKGRVLKTIQLN